MGQLAAASSNEEKSKELGSTSTESSLKQTDLAAHPMGEASGCFLVIAGLLDLPGEERDITEAGFLTSLF